MISKKQVLHIAKLARIALSSREEEKYQKELSSILDFVDKLKEVDVGRVEPTFHSLLLKNVMREDEARPKPREETQRLRALMPETKDDFLKVKAVFNQTRLETKA